MPPSLAADILLRTAAGHKDKHVSFHGVWQILHFFYTLKVCSDPASSKSTGTTFSNSICSRGVSGSPCGSFVQHVVHFSVIALLVTDLGDQ